MAWAEMTRSPATAIWEKPQGKAAPIVLEKHWRVVPRGVALVIGCQTFPTWNSYPGLFASLATGNTVIVKPHPGATLPLALTVAVLRDVLAEQGLPRDVVLLAADSPEAPITKELVSHPRGRRSSTIPARTPSAPGSARTPARRRSTPRRRASTRSSIAATADFAAMCANVAFSLSLYSGQMCTAPQDIFVPRGGIETDAGHKSFDEVAAGIAAAVDSLLADPARAAGVCGAIANPATLDRIAAARGLGRIVRDSAPLAEGRSATPLIVAVDAADEAAYGEERFGPIAFVVAVDGCRRRHRPRRRSRPAQGRDHRGALRHRRGAHPARGRRLRAAGVNLSVNLTGNIFVNQSAAFSDFHVTGPNPAGNASLTDAAFVASRFARAMWRRPVAA